MERMCSSGVWCCRLIVFVPHAGCVPRAFIVYARGKSVISQPTGPQLSSSAQLGPTDCPSPVVPGLTSGAHAVDCRVGRVVLSPVCGFGGEVDTALLSRLGCDLTSLPPGSSGIAP